MTIIFSKTEVDGLAGIYANPLLFDGRFGGATLVITKHENIRLAAEKKGIKVRGFEGTTIAPTPPEAPPALLTPLGEGVGITHVDAAPVVETVVEAPKKAPRKRAPRKPKAK